MQTSFTLRLRMSTTKEQPVIDNQDSNEPSSSVNAEEEEELPIRSLSSMMIRTTVSVRLGNDHNEETNFFEATHNITEQISSERNTAAGSQAVINPEGSAGFVNVTPGAAGEVDVEQEAPAQNNEQGAVGAQDSTGQFVSEQAVGAQDAAVVQSGSEQAVGTPDAPGQPNEMEALRPVEEPEQEVMANRVEAIRQQLVHLRNANLAELPGFLLPCLFESIGCRMTFNSPAARNRHMTGCFFGVFRVCTHQDCNGINHNGFGSVYALALHGTSLHECGLTMTNGEVNVQFDIDLQRSLLTLNNLQYKLQLLRRFEFMKNDHLFKMLLAIVTRDIGLPQPLFMLVPILYSENVIVDDLVDVRIQLRGAAGEIITPIIPAPGDSMQTENGKVITTAFRSSREFYQFASVGEKVLFFSHSDIQRLAFHEDTSLDGQLSLQVELKGLQCTIRRDVGLMENVFATSWQDLNLEQTVRDVMDDGADIRPSRITRIVVPQLSSWHVDLLLECANLQTILSNVMTALFNDVLKTRLQQENQDEPVEPRRARTIMLFPTISSIRAFQRKWRTIGNQVGVNIYSLESLARELIENLKMYGTDIILMTPGQWNMAITRATAALVPVMHGNLRYIVVVQPDRMTYQEALQDMRVCFESIQEERRDLIMRVAVGERISPQTATLMRTGLFNEDFNFISVGRNANHLIERFEPPRQLQFPQKAEAIVQIFRQGPSQAGKRILVIAVRNDQRFPRAHADLLSKLNSELGEQNIIAITRERDVLDNENFFNHFLCSNNCVLVAPYFILDYAEVQFSTHIILWTPPIEEHKVRIGKLVQGTNKAVIQL